MSYGRSMPEALSSDDLLDNANLEQLAAACQQRQRYTFMLCLGPLRLRRVTGSPSQSNRPVLRKKTMRQMTLMMFLQRALGDSYVP